MAPQEAQERLHKSPSASSIVVVMVPFPAQSHLNGLLQLSHIISSYNIQVHYVGSSLHNSQVKSRSAIRNPSIIFHDLPTPDFPSPLPHNTEFPSHLVPSFKASVGLRQPTKSLLASLSESTRRLVVIHDLLMSYVVQDACELPNAESYIFHCASAVYSFAYVRDMAELKMREEIPPFEGTLDDEFLNFVHRQAECLKMKKLSGHLRNTCRLIESEFLDFIEEKEREADENIKHWAIGPLRTVTKLMNRAKSSSDHGKRVGQCLEWLNKQEPKSVLYVSFGTTTFMEDEQIRELAIGLEKSGVKFIWILRDADKGDIFDQVEVRRPQLPLGFEERVEGEGIGMVVREWAPQLEILGHPSTGGFMSHCGWNSCLESLSLGVPLAAWPMHSDQPTNGALVVSVLKAGLVVRECAKREELVSSSAIAEVVKRLMKSNEGDAIKKRAEDLGFELRKCTEEGGVSRLELESFVAHITRI